MFKHNPLAFHKDAMPAARASIAAQKQGKFWEYHDQLFSNQRALAEIDLIRYARQLGLDIPKFKSDMQSAETSAQIKRDQKLAAEVQARGTPNTFVNGRQVSGARPFADFKTVIDEEIIKAKARILDGVSRSNVYLEIIDAGKTFKPLDDDTYEFTVRNSQALGSSYAKIKLYEFADFQCPYCSRLTPFLKQLKEKYGDDLAIIYKHYPLSFHKQAMPAAKASLAAGEQGYFWEYHDKLFANQKRLKDATDDTFIGWAAEVGLDLEQFESALKDPKWDAIIEEEMNEGRAAKLRGTPTLYLNGRKYEGGFTVQEISRVIDREILGN